MSYRTMTSRAYQSGGLTACKAVLYGMGPTVAADVVSTLDEIGFRWRSVASHRDEIVEAFAVGHTNVLLLFASSERLVEAVAAVREVRATHDDNVRLAPIVALSDKLTESMASALVSAGVDDIALWPMTATALKARVQRTVSDPATFFRTAEYFGPDRRRGILSDASPKSERRDVPKTRWARISISRRPDRGCRVEAVREMYGQNALWSSAGANYLAA